jgi:hypothetical protein
LLNGINVNDQCSPHVTSLCLSLGQLAGWPALPLRRSGIANSKVIGVAAVFVDAESLGHNVCKHVVGTNMLNKNKVALNEILEEFVLNVQVFRLVARTRSDVVNGGFVVTVYGRGALRRTKPVEE